MKVRDSTSQIFFFKKEKRDSTSLKKKNVTPQDWVTQDGIGPVKMFVKYINVKYMQKGDGHKLD